MRLSVWYPQKTKNILLCLCGNWTSSADFRGALADHVFVQGMLRQAHAFCFCQGSHWAVKVCGSGEIQKCAGKLVVRHYDDVQPAMTVARQPAHTHVFFLLSILLVAHQIVCQKP